MELQLGLGLGLGLALPSNNSVEGFDQNRFGYEPNKDQGQGLLLQLLGSDPCSSFVSNRNKKRRFDQAFLENDQAIVTVPETLPLLLWNHQPNDEDDDPIEDLNNKNKTYSFIKNDGEGDGVVGWPPIKSWRKKLCCRGGRAAENNNNNNRLTVLENGCSCGGRISKFMYVKVKMEGVAIARKVDLNLHTSFQTLMDTLMDMFAKYSDNYKLTYQDREGDWLLAQDVPWRTFIRSVQRLKLLRRSH
ncbi:AUX/IAA protein [Trema orientale]|uniref:Auxin-responsive protein n=1 Tax=Trema orientale TaxID=63057 RepID=A0A2P5FPU5_TREOI|nr:AUX/IAA protein [Trema orientale]